MKNLITKLNLYFEDNNGRNSYCWMYIFIMFSQLFIYFLGIIGYYNIIFYNILGIPFCFIELIRVTNVEVEYENKILTWDDLIENAKKENWLINKDNNRIKIPTVSDDIWFEVQYYNKRYSNFYIYQINKNKVGYSIFSGILLDNIDIWVYIQPYKENKLKLKYIYLLFLILFYIRIFIMAVIIKNMEMPKRCRACVSLIENEYTFRCLIGKIKFSEFETGESYENYNYIHPKCPFKEYPNEDMTWEELFEKVKNIKSFRTIGGKFDFNIENVWFLKNGHTQKFDKLKLKPYQMWLIIQSIIG